MERKADLPPRRTNLGCPIEIGGDESNHNNLTSSSTSSSSSSSTLSTSPPDFLRYINAVFKRHRPLGMTHGNFPRATRVLVPKSDPSKSSTSTSSVVAGNISNKLPRTAANRGAGRLLNAGFNQRKDSVAEGRSNTPEDSSLTPPSITGTVTEVREENMCPFGMQKGEDELLGDRKKSSLAASSSHFDVDFKKDKLSSIGSSHVHFQKGDGQYSDEVATSDLDLKKLDLPHIKMPGTSGANVVEKRDKIRHNLHYLDPMTRSIVAGSSCATTMSILSGPTFQCTHAPLLGHTGFPTQMSSAVESSSANPAQILPEGRETLVKECDGVGHHQQSVNAGEGTREKVVSGSANHLQSQVLSTSNSEPPQMRKAEKAPRKKKYDPDVFFKVNGKLYQKLGKIGSGGSSEVHKVITSDCTIYALKKIKLKGRDYPTAYGFCQEIEYLNKLKGKSNIIQLIDYEVTDKTLLQEVMNGSMTIKDGRIKDDQFIYMVLEYGEIDLAHMLSQKWKEVDSSSLKIDENWLRFYWQQMLEAVNTIHEERIVHSDLKPANFLLVRGSLKLIDFGIAKAILSDTTNIQRDAQVGTLNYMSPEAFMWNEQDACGNTIKCGRPSDIWSLGCILYQMVYGKTPFAEYKTFWAKFKVITDKKHEISYEPISNPMLVDLMKRCLAWDRNERWRIPQLLQHPFLLPPVPRELPLLPLQNIEQYKFLLERVGAYWNEPEVMRLLSELSGVVANLERGHKD